MNMHQNKSQAQENLVRTLSVKLQCIKKNVREAATDTDASTDEERNEMKTTTTLMHINLLKWRENTLARTMKRRQRNLHSEVTVLKCSCS